MIPQPLYEALPYIYTIAGLASIMGLDPTGGRVCGAILLSAGVLIIKMRKDYRQK